MTTDRQLAAGEHAWTIAGAAFAVLEGNLETKLAAHRHTGYFPRTKSCARKSGDRRGVIGQWQIAAGNFNAVNRTVGANENPQHRLASR